MNALGVLSASADGVPHRSRQGMRRRRPCFLGSGAEARSAFEIDAFGFRRGEDGKDRQRRVDHHEQADVDIGLMDAP